MPASLRSPTRVQRCVHSSSAPVRTSPTLQPVYTRTQAFLGLDDGFSQEIGHIFFLPGFHACGTLDILSVADLAYSDLDLLPSHNDSIAHKWLDAPTHVKESNSSEGTILAWAKGWRSSCGKGDANKEVRVSKVIVDGVPDGAPRSEWANALGESGSAK
jgi:hypothetical protein